MTPPAEHAAEQHDRAIVLHNRTARPWATMRRAARLTRELAAAKADLADERRRCTRHAHILAARAFSAPAEYPAVLAMTEAISSGKPAP